MAHPSDSTRNNEKGSQDLKTSGQRAAADVAVLESPQIFALPLSGSPRLPAHALAVGAGGFSTEGPARLWLLLGAEGGHPQRLEGYIEIHLSMPQLESKGLRLASSQLKESATPANERSLTTKLVCDLQRTRHHTLVMRCALRQLLPKQRQLLPLYGKPLQSIAIRD